ncbi:hypothetical protein TNCV_4793621 [Trichonephila clavipes]|nr:hypothetical protein TNCV_4793621 [Trichonephila clavipes]
MVAYRDCGFFFREIGQRVERNHATVMWICHRWMQGETMDKRGRSHPPHGTTDRDDSIVECAQSAHCFVYPSLESTRVCDPNGMMNCGHEQWNGTTLCLFTNPAFACNITMVRFEFEDTEAPREIEIKRENGKLVQQEKRKAERVVSNHRLKVQAILGELEKNGLDIQNCRGQGYNNGANMVGINSGVKTRILNRNPLPIFTPCGYHMKSVIGRRSYTRAFGDGPRNFEPWSSDEDET